MSCVRLCVRESVRAYMRACVRAMLDDVRIIVFLWLFHHRPKYNSQPVAILNK